jgi:hypothetical protein
MFHFNFKKDINWDKEGKPFKGFKERKEKLMSSEGAICEVIAVRGNSHAPITALLHAIRINRMSYHYFLEGDLIKKSVRGSDTNWEDCTIEDRVFVNHNSDLLFHKSSEEDLNKANLLGMKYKGDGEKETFLLYLQMKSRPKKYETHLLNYKGESMSISEFIDYKEDN